MTTPPNPLADTRGGGGTPTAPLVEALAFYDSLPAVTVTELRGAWVGRGLHTGNRLDGLLEAFGWHGKRFDGPETTHPLVMDGPRGTFSLNPAVIPVRLMLRLTWLLKQPLVGRALRRLLPLLATRKPAARLRTVTYRGVPTATMIYDALPIHDHFHRIDEDTLIGVMDLRGLDDPLLFILEREHPQR